MICSDVLLAVTCDSALASIRPEHSHRIDSAFRFLLEHGYINFGLSPAFKTTPALPPAEIRPNVVVIDAGLAAARQLISLGFSVLLLEGRNRPGGRVKTRRMQGYLKKMSLCQFVKNSSPLEHLCLALLPLHQGSVSTFPDPGVVSVLTTLCKDQKNLVFLVSGKDKKSLTEWFSSCGNLGIAAEHGYFIRESNETEWDNCKPVADLEWMQIVELIMQLYTKTTDGSFMDVKETTLAWDYRYTDRDFGACQAKELINHLESVSY